MHQNIAMNKIFDDSVDILTLIADNPPPMTIILVSGNRNFAYSLSVLRLRRYSTVLVAPLTKENVHQSLCNQADVVVDWSDVERREFGIDDASSVQPEDRFRARSALFLLAE
jgi:hypothetical protein